jgi:hypothetical protein
MVTLVITCPSRVLNVFSDMVNIIRDFFSIKIALTINKTCRIYWKQIYLFSPLVPPFHIAGTALLYCPDIFLISDAVSTIVD